MKIHEDVAHSLSDDTYLRSRLTPTPGQTYFLHLKDLRSALETVRSTAAIRILDFGCGGSPYRSLFPNAEYKRADYVPSPGIDYLIGDDQLVPVPDQSFDLVLSTQVLEHVQNTDVYLSECRRILRPGGSLVLSTHGFFAAHGCPFDFRRWTAEGLHREIEKSGFKVDSLQKLTCGGRAMAFLLHLHFDLIAGPRRRDPLGFIYWLLIRTNSRVIAAFDRWSDRRFQDIGVVDASDSGQDMYIGLLVRAVRPAL